MAFYLGIVSTVMWFRRDLRLQDNPALAAAATAQGDGRVVPLFVVDPVLWSASGPVRRAYLRESLRALDESLDGNLLLRYGDPAAVVPQVAAAAGARSVHVADDFAPYGRRRDAEVEAALGDVQFVRTGSSYAVAPGRVTKDDGTSYRVFTPYYRGWVLHGWRAPADEVPGETEWWMPMACDGYPEVSDLGGLRLPPAGEEAAWARWEEFRSSRLASYSDLRNRADLDGTSAISHHLRFGELHPRSLLADLGDEDETFRKELCWREFYADVLHQRPDSARASLDPRFDTEMPWSSGSQADDLFAAWCEGRTGYPFVDAGMRQLRAEGWVHNRVRMVVASFLVKDLHLPWQRGAREFMHWLRDGDLASNAHGWQWTAGCGTDAAPFYRVFNPVLQGLRFDPEGAYVRRYVPELRHLASNAVHEPWNTDAGYSGGYPRPVVDHATERGVALADFAMVMAAPQGVLDPGTGAAYSSSDHDQDRPRHSVGVSDRVEVEPSSEPIGIPTPRPVVLPRLSREQIILDSHPQARSLGAAGPLGAAGAFASPGVLYVIHQEDDGVDVVIADSLAKAAKRLTSVSGSDRIPRRGAIWVAGRRTDVIRESPVLSSVGSAGRQAPPTTIRGPKEWLSAPHGAGVYRIYLLDSSGTWEESVYVGRSRDFRERPYQHERIPRGVHREQLWNCPSGVSRIQLIYVKADGGTGVVTAVDIDALEAEHIARMRERHESDPGHWPRVLNQKKGKNGPPSSPGTHYLYWPPEMP